MAIWNRIFSKKEKVKAAQLNIDNSETKLLERRLSELTSLCEKQQEDLSRLRAEKESAIDEKLESYESLSKAKIDAEKIVKDLEAEHKRAVEDIKHMQKMLDEKKNLENERAIFDAEKKAQEEIVQIRKEYSNKMEEELKNEREKMTKFMEKVMAALPNVNVKMK